jgi:hypothetical protein
VLSALAMGARCVVAPGRNMSVLDDLKRRFGARLATVCLTGDSARDSDAIRAAAPGQIDAVLDFLPPSVDATVAVQRSCQCGLTAVWFSWEALGCWEETIWRFPTPGSCAT